MRIVHVLSVAIQNFAAFATSALSLSLRAWHATVSLAPEGAHDVLVLEKGLGPSLLVERLIEHSCAVKNKPH